MGMPTKKNVKSCWYCGDLATDIVGGRPICPYCNTKLAKEMKRRTMEFVGGVVFFGSLVLAIWMMMTMTDKNWIPIH